MKANNPWEQKTMPDEKTVEFSSKIDREITGTIAIAGQPGGTRLLAPKSLQELMEFAKLMAVSGAAIRPQFRGNPGTCLAILMQALKWNADPWAVANKAYVVRNRAGEETIAYEAQLINAIVNTHAALKGGLEGHYTGKIEDRTRVCMITGELHGKGVKAYESPMLKQIAVQNSPLWQADPDQQLWYYSTRAWARRHVPEILLGIYTPEELRGELIDMTPGEQPKTGTEALRAKLAGKPPAEPAESDPVSDVSQDASVEDAAPASQGEVDMGLAEPVGSDSVMGFQDVASEDDPDTLIPIVLPSRGPTGRVDWVRYANDVIAAARITDPMHMHEFRVRIATPLNQLRLSNKAEWERVTKALAALERGEDTEDEKDLKDE